MARCDLWSLACALPLGCLVLGCGEGAPENVSIARQAVTGAPDAADTGDPAVVLVAGVTDGGAGTTYWGTGSVVSPHVVLTAAHVLTAVGQASTKYLVFAGTDTSNATSADWLPVREIHVDPAFENGAPGSAHDVAVVILDTPLNVTPLPLQRSTPDSTWVGKPIRFVGYGYVSSLVADQPSGGTRRQASSTIGALVSGYLDTTPGGPQPCLGDSGGPGLVTVDGTELLAGVVQGGDSACMSASFTRVDLNTDFIDQWIDAFDPPPDAGATSSDSADEDAPPVEAVSDANSAPIGSEPAPGIDTSLGPTVGCTVTATPPADRSGAWLLAACVAVLSARRQSAVRRRH